MKESVSGDKSCVVKKLVLRTDIFKENESTEEGIQKDIKDKVFQCRNVEIY